MLAQCLSLLFVLNAVNISYVNVPFFSQRIMVAHVHNLTCSALKLPTGSYAVTPTSKSLTFAGGGSIACTMQLDFFAYHGVLTIGVHAPSFQVSIATVPEGNTCDTGQTNVSTCEVPLVLDMLFVTPPSPLLDRVLLDVRKLISDGLHPQICEVMVPKFEKLLTNHTLDPPAPPPGKMPGSLPLQQYAPFRAASNIIAALPPILGFDIAASFVEEVTLRLSFTASKGRHINFTCSINVAGGTERDPYPATWVEWAKLIDRIMEGGIVVEHLVLPYLEGTVQGISLDSDIPGDAQFSFDVSLPDLQWNEATRAYDIPWDSGVIVSNIRSKNSGDAGRVTTNAVGPRLAVELNKAITSFLQRSRSISYPAAHRIPLPSFVSRLTGPSAVHWIIFLTSMGVICGALMLLNVIRHRRNPILYAESTETVSVYTVIWQDAILCTAVIVCSGCILWSNFSTAATVVAGRDLTVYSFSMRNTVGDMWASGLYVLAVCVLLLSGVYPYVKLASILVFTMVLQRPDSTLLHIIDYVGKYSLLDTFVMLIMVGGLTVHGIADVAIHTPFYLFMAGTIGSMAVGNYATHLWRRGTSVRCRPGDTLDGLPPESTPLLSAVPELSERIAEIRPPRSRMPWRIRIAATAIVLLCSLPVWIWPFLSYRLGGLASLVTGHYSAFNLYDLSLSTSPACFVATLVTVLVAPVLFAAGFPANGFIASWCAADVLLLACLLSHLQLNQFIQFVLGEGMEAVFSAHAHLLWPTIPLGAAAIFSWVLAISDMLQIDLLTRAPKSTTGRLIPSTVETTEDTTQQPSQLAG